MTKIIDANLENPNGIERDMTAEEEAQVITDAENNVIRKQAEADAQTVKDNEATAKATAKASGNTKLLDLGLTQEEATALTGYTPE